MSENLIGSLGHSRFYVNNYSLQVVEENGVYSLTIHDLESDTVIVLNNVENSELRTFLDNEENRILAENERDRKENERQRSESSRALAEDTRVNSESARSDYYTEIQKTLNEKIGEIESALEETKGPISFNSVFDVNETNKTVSLNPQYSMRDYAAYADDSRVSFESNYCMFLATISGSPPYIYVNIPLFRSLENINSAECTDFFANIAPGYIGSSDSKHVDGGINFTSNIDNITIDKVSNSLIVRIKQGNLSGFDRSKNETLQVRCGTRIGFRLFTSADSVPNGGATYD